MSNKRKFLAAGLAVLSSLGLFSCDKKPEETKNKTIPTKNFDFNINTRVDKEYDELRKQLQEIQKQNPEKIWTLEEEEEMIRKLLKEKQKRNSK